jgi:hypothetical protein
MPPGDESRQAPIETYLASQNLTERNTALDVFWVLDTTGITPKPLGQLILDVGDREGKTRDVFCTSFSDVRNFTFSPFFFFPFFLADSLLCN